MLHALIICALLLVFIYTLYCFLRAYAAQRAAAEAAQELNRIFTTVLDGREHWKSFAIALEVFCECCADGDHCGANHAMSVIQREREILRSLGEYDG